MIGVVSGTPTPTRLRSAQAIATGGDNRGTAVLLDGADISCAGELELPAAPPDHGHVAVPTS